MYNASSADNRSLFLPFSNFVTAWDQVDGAFVVIVSVRIASSAPFLFILAVSAPKRFFRRIASASYLPTDVGLPVKSKLLRNRGCRDWMIKQVGHEENPFANILRPAILTRIAGPCYLLHKCVSSLLKTDHIWHPKTHRHWASMNLWKEYVGVDLPCHSPWKWMSGWLICRGCEC